jgi:hypothetical protein
VSAMGLQVVTAAARTTSSARIPSHQAGVCHSRAAPQRPKPTGPIPNALSPCFLAQMALAMPFYCTDAQPLGGAPCRGSRTKGPVQYGRPPSTNP